MPRMMAPCALSLSMAVEMTEYVPERAIDPAIGCENFEVRVKHKTSRQPTQLPSRVWFAISPEAVNFGSTLKTSLTRIGTPCSELKRSQ